MCGIVALHSAVGGVNEEQVRTGLLQIYHRGPDGLGVWRDPLGNAALGHTRLSIIGLGTGAQPIANEDGTVHIVVNGEFYGFEEIRRDLENRGHRFRTDSDSEIALHLYEIYGHDCLRYLRGEFALAIWDTKTRELFVARDRFGIKPLYYATVGSTLAFASEIKAILAMGLPARWDLDSVFHTVSTQYCLQNRTLFQGVHTLPPGHFAVAGDRTIKIERYWDLDYPTAYEKLSDQDYIEQYRQALTEAIKVRLRADVPVSCYLSGGLDSSAVAGIAKQVTGKPLKAYTITFDSPDFNEESIAQDTAQKLGFDFVPVHVAGYQLVESFADSLWHAETLAFNGHGVAKYLLSKAVNQSGRKVVLTGEGADETLAGYPSFVMDVLADIEDDQRRVESTKNLLKKNELLQGLLLPHGEMLPLGAVEQKLGFVPAWIKAKAAMGYVGQSLLHKDVLREYQGKDPYQSFLNPIDISGQLTNRPRLHQSMYLYCKASLPNYVLTLLGDRMEMANSVEGRLPFLDHKVVELVRGFPTHIKIRDGVEKYILREAAKPYVTENIYARTKHGFTSPAAFRMKGSPMHRYIHGVLGSDKVASFFDASQVKALLRHWDTATDAEATKIEGVLLMALSASLLERRFVLS